MLARAAVRWAYRLAPACGGGAAVLLQAQDMLRQVSKQNARAALNKQTRAALRCAVAQAATGNIAPRVCVLCMQSSV